MPLLDVSSIMSDPDFVDITLACIRSVQTMGSYGRAVNAPTTTAFSGVVTQATGNQLVRGDGSSYIKGTILVHSTFFLTAGNASNDADVITWRGRKFTVADVADWSTYGAGFTCATCEPLLLSGS